MTKTLILNGDGYLGWPTAMHLTARGHEVAVAGYPLTVYGKGEADPGVFEYQGYPQLRKAGPGESG